MEILILEIKKTSAIGPSQLNTVDKEAQSCDFSRTNHGSTAMCAPENGRTKSFSPTLQAFSSSRILGEVLKFLDSNIG